MKVFVTASNNAFASAKKTSILFARYLGKFDKCIAYDIDTMIDDDFRKKNYNILSLKKGVGLWLWKPYFINKALIEECEVGDTLFYLDAAGFFIGNANRILSKMNDDFFVSQVPFIEEEFTKIETFIAMNLTEEKYMKTRQFQASFMAFKKNMRTIEFVEEWLLLCTNINIISNEHNFSSQKSNFVDHRMDQSVFSLLCKKYKIDPHQDPTQYGILGYPTFLDSTYLKIISKKEYPTTIILHRRRRFFLPWVILYILRVHMPSYIIKLTNKLHIS